MAPVAGTYGDLLYRQVALDIINSHNASQPLYLNLALQVSTSLPQPLQVPMRVLTLCCKFLSRLIVLVNFRWTTIRSKPPRSTSTATHTSTHNGLSLTP